MLKHAITLAAVTTLLAACSAPTDPSQSPNARVNFSQTELGTIGEPNCFGQSMAFIAQLGRFLGADYRGVGGTARHPFDLTGQEGPITVQQVKTTLDEYCAGL
jgi:hypothetical protein